MPRRRNPGQFGSERVHRILGCELLQASFHLNLREPPLPTVIAHRGASAYEQENTLVAFRAAAALGADAVELDVRRTADSALVVHHDPTLADGRTIVELRADELPFYVPSLADALLACGGLRVNVEIKNLPPDPDFDPEETVAAGVVALVRDLGLVSQVIVSSFHLPTIDRVREIGGGGGGVATAYLSLDASVAHVERAVRHGHGAYHPWHIQLTAPVVAAAKNAGLELNTWTVDNPDRMAELLGWGVDGLITNVPDIARSVVDRG
jgi:glycerophosphoryl diester phosphodiesterase